MKGTAAAWRDLSLSSRFSAACGPIVPVEESEGDRVQVPWDRHRPGSSITDHCGQLNISPAVLFETAHCSICTGSRTRLQSGGHRAEHDEPGDLMEKDRLGMFTAERAAVRQLSR